MEGPLERARIACERATFDGDASDLDDAARDLDSLAAAVSLGRGQILHARHMVDRTVVVYPIELRLFESAAELFRHVGDARGEGESLFWVGCFHQVVRADHAAADRALAEAESIARGCGDEFALSYVLRHQGVAAHVAGDLERAATLLRESTALRQKHHFSAGVAANLVGLAHIAHAQGDSGRAFEILTEAAELAEAAGADAIRAQVDEARQQMGTAN